MHHNCHHCCCLDHYALKHEYLESDTSKNETYLRKRSCLTIYVKSNWRQSPN